MVMKSSIHHGGKMEDETFARKCSALKTILGQMDVPPKRIEPLRRTDVRWLGRNLQIRNGDHPMFETASGLIRWLLRNWPDT
jgi:hypothetical protein